MSFYGNYNNVNHNSKRNNDRECSYNYNETDEYSNYSDYSDYNRYNSDKYMEYDQSNWNCSNDQTHTHEYEGSVKIAEAQEDPHNHRFACVTGEAIFTSDGSHFHKLHNNTDFYEEHFHKMCDVTGPAIPVGNGRHVHFVCGDTTINDGHQHEFQFATLIDDPIGH